MMTGMVRPFNQDAHVLVQLGVGVGGVQSRLISENSS